MAGHGHEGRTEGNVGQSHSGPGKTGTKDVTFNLVSILYHALEGADTYNQYIQDAEAEGDQDLAKFFRRVKEEEMQRAEECKKILSRYFGRSGVESQRRAA